MNTNIYGTNGYSAQVTGGNSDNKIHWGFAVKEEHGDCFTITLANEILDFANQAYKKGIPEGYYKEAYNPNVDFTYIRYDMTDYRDNGETMMPVSKRKIGIYDKRKNLLRIYVDGEPVYENRDGKICRDTVAMMDSDPTWNGNL